MELCLKMPSFIDLTGQQYGRLLVIRRASNSRGKVVWICRCTCGNTINVVSNSLRTGNTRSCGCFQKEIAKRIGNNNALDIAGQRYGHLVAIKAIKNKEDYKTVWECQCDCGNTHLVKLVDLQRGHVKSCGCSTGILLSVANTKHGLSNTKEYKRANIRRNKEKRVLLDTKWTFEMELALKDFQKECAICNSTENLEIDHVLPLSKGCGLKPGNSVMLCRSCNAIKHAKDITELPLEWQANLIWNAFKFKDHWDMIHES